MLDREEIVASARSWMGVRWKHQGRSRAGIDCAGLIIKVAHALEVTDFDSTNYGRQPDGKTLLELFDEHLVRKATRTPEPGDAGLFRESVHPLHCAIFSWRRGRLHLVHGHATRRKVVEEPFDHEWPERLIYVHEFPGVEPWAG